MDTCVKFCARGTMFCLSKTKLEEYPDVLLNLLSKNTGIPVDKINGAIYIDISPSCVKHIIDYYNLGKYDTDDYFILMDLKYINMYKGSDVLPSGYTVANQKIEPQNTNIYPYNKLKEYKYCNLHTADGRIILMSPELYSNETIHKLNIALDEKNVSNGDYAEGYVCVTEKIMHKILSIVRDGVNSYYNYLMDDRIQTHMKTILEYANTHMPYMDAYTPYLNISVPNSVCSPGFPGFPGSPGFPGFPGFQPVNMDRHYMNSFINEKKMREEIYLCVERYVESRIIEESTAEKKYKRSKKNKRLTKYLKVYGLL